MGRNKETSTAEAELFDSSCLLQQQPECTLQTHIFLWGTAIRGGLFRWLGEATGFSECRHSPGLQSSESLPKDGDQAVGDRAQESSLELCGLFALLNLIPEQKNKAPLVALSSAGGLAFSMPSLTHKQLSSIAWPPHSSPHFVLLLHLFLPPPMCWHCYFRGQNQDCWKDNILEAGGGLLLADYATLLAEQP